MRLKNYIKKYFDFKRFKKSRHKKYKCPIVKQEKLNKYMTGVFGIWMGHKQK